MATQTLTDLIVRPATQADITALEIFIKPFVEDGKLLRRTYDELADLLDEFFVAELHGEIVGCAALEIYSPKLAEIRSLAVSPRVQGMGVGRHLVDACVARARDRHILEVMAITSSEAFFKACGFDFTLPGEKKALFIQTRDEL
ncbi:MAG: GNAT family N-acetyltransferase [Anaerolineae bacterium]|nr:GNAT family N-acetyltransferase [Anaerolineae bacterium]